MDDLQIFEDWFKKTFVPAVRKHLRTKKLPEMAVLLLDNCRAHPPAETLTSADGLISVLSLPPNTTSKIQPLDQGIISVFKRNYRTELVKEMIESSFSFVPFLKQYTLKDAFYVVSKAWTSIEDHSIANCWKKALPILFQDDSQEEEDDEEVFLGFSNEEVEAAESKLREVLGEDSSLSDFNNNISELEAMCPITETLTDHEIIDNAKVDQPEEEPEEPEQSADPEPPKPQLKASDIVVRLQDCEEWLEKQSDADPLQLIHLRNLRSFAQRKT